MEVSRRKLLFSASSIIICSIFCIACKPVAKTTKRGTERSMLTNPTAGELEILSSTGTHLLGRHSNGPIKITNRSFSGEVQFDQFYWSNIEFENCDFINCSMTRGTLLNVRFVNCLFFANMWQDRNWENISFHGCAWHGPFKMGASKGEKSIQFEECEFVGATERELGYGGRAEYFGAIGGTNGRALFRKCKFERTFIYGGLSTECVNSKMLDVGIYVEESSKILFENVTASGLIDLGNNNFSTVVFKQSTFSDRLTFEGATIGSALFEEINANLDLSAVKAASVFLKRVTFTGPLQPKPRFQYGLNCESSKIEHLEIDNCSFEGANPELYLSGEETPEELSMESSAMSQNVYSTDIENLVLRSTPIINGHFRYMRITKLLMENLRITSADFSRSIIDQFMAKNVTQAENLKLGSATVKKNASGIRFRSSG